MQQFYANKHKHEIISRSIVVEHANSDYSRTSMFKLVMLACTDVAEMRRPNESKPSVLMGLYDMSKDFKWGWTLAATSRTDLGMNERDQHDDLKHDVTTTYEMLFRLTRK